MRKWISALLVCSMLLSLIPAGVLATEEEAQSVIPAPQQSTVEDSGNDASTQDKGTEAPSESANTGTEPAETPQDNADAEPTADIGDVDGSALDAPDETNTPEPVADPTTAPEADVGQGPAWIVESAHRRYGELKDLLPIAMINQQEIYLCTTETIELTYYTLDELQTVAFAMDTDALGEFCEDKSVILSTVSRSGAARSGTVYIWIGYASDIPKPSDVLGGQVEINPDEDAVLETEIMVQADTDISVPGAPTFTLTAYPDLQEGMAFAVLLGEAEPVLLEGSTFAPAESGTYRFVVMDAAGTVVARSAEYAVVYAENTGADGAMPTETPLPTPVVLTEANVLQVVSLADTLVEIPAPELSVQATDYAEGMISQSTPSFTLSGAPAEGGYYYGLTINDSAVVRLRSNQYAVTSSGEYNIVFYLLDRDGNVMDTSGSYNVLVDYSEAKENNEAWMAVGEAKRYGTLASLLAEAGKGDSIYLLTDAVIAVPASTTPDAVNLQPDPNKYSGDYGVIVSDTSPLGESTEGTAYVWLGTDGVAAVRAIFYTTATFTVDTAKVAERDLVDDLWVNGTDAIMFGITDPTPGMAFAIEVATDGASFSAFVNGSSLSSITPGLVSGNDYTLSFRISEDGNPANTETKVYQIHYDNESPVLMCSAGANNTVKLIATDSASGFYTQGEGLLNVTFAGSTIPIVWTALLTPVDASVYSYSVQYGSAGTIAANTLGVRDRANNVTLYPTAITISAGTGGPGGPGSGGEFGGGGMGSTGGGGTGMVTRTISHSTSTYTTVTAYNGVELVIASGAMNSLVIGDQTLDLELLLDGDTPVQTAFTAAFTNWSGQSDTEDAAVDTLVLTAAQSNVQAGQNYYWTFDGLVYKKLAASGIDYLVLAVGNHAMAIPTSGFVAGVRYNMYRASGLASGSFVYAIRMGEDISDASMRVTVEGQDYTLTNDQDSEFYYYNIDSGTIDMLSEPRSVVQETASDSLQG